MDFFLDRDSVGNFNALIQISYTPVFNLWNSFFIFNTNLFSKNQNKNVDSKSKNLLNKIISFSFISVIIVIMGSFILYSIGGQLLTLVFPIEYLVILEYMPVSFLSWTFCYWIIHYHHTIFFGKIRSCVIKFHSRIDNWDSFCFYFCLFFGFMGGVIALLIHGFLT